MNEKQIEIALAKLRKLYKQTKTKVGRERIEFAAKTLKQGITGSLIPLSFSQRNTDSVKQRNWLTDVEPMQGNRTKEENNAIVDGGFKNYSPKPFNPDALDLKVDDAGNVYAVWHKAVKA